MYFPSKLSVSVVIPVYNGGESFRQCLSNLAKTIPQPQEIIVVADGDTDNSWRLAEQFGARVLRIPTCGGPARARNLGVRAAKSDIILFVDADVAIAPDAIGKVAIAFEQDPTLAAMIGSYDDAPGATNFLSQYKNLLHHYTHQISNEEAFTFWGAIGAIRRDIFLGIGGFDESYRLPSIEDIELGYRLKKAGHQIRLCKTLQGKHLKHWGLISLLRADFFYRAIPWTALILRDRSLPNDLNLGVSSRFSVILTYKLAIVLAGALWWPSLLIAAGLIGIPLLLINAPLYRFFGRKHGLFFALKTIPWHWFYYFYGGLAFAVGVVRHLFYTINLPRVTRSIS
jgi:glycosyltransferase involved in cell wall biosynthesis